MANGIGANDPRELNKGGGLKFRVGSRVREETPEEGRRTYRTKRCEYNYNKDEDNRPKNLNVISEFEFQLRYYVYFRTNTLGQGMNPLIPQARLNNITPVLL